MTMNLFMLTGYEEVYPEHLVRVFEEAPGKAPTVDKIKVCVGINLPPAMYTEYSLIGGWICYNLESGMFLWRIWYIAMVLIFFPVDNNFTYST